MWDASRYGRSDAKQKKGETAYPEKGHQHESMLTGHPWMTAVVRDAIGGNAEDMGETCAAWFPVRVYCASGASAVRPGPVVALGVAGVPPDDDVGTFPMNQEGTQPLSPVSSLTACSAESVLNGVDLNQGGLHMTNGCTA